MTDTVTPSGSKASHLQQTASTSLSNISPSNGNDDGERTAQIVEPSKHLHYQKGHDNVDVLSIAENDVPRESEDVTKRQTFEWESIARVFDRLFFVCLSLRCRI